MKGVLLLQLLLLLLPVVTWRHLPLSKQCSASYAQFWPNTKQSTKGRYLENISSVDEDSFMSSQINLLAYHVIMWIMCSSCLTWQRRRRKLQEYCSILPLQCSSKNNGNILVFWIFDTFVNHLCNIEHQSVGEAQIKMEKLEKSKTNISFQISLSRPSSIVSLSRTHTHFAQCMHRQSIGLDSRLALPVCQLCCLAGSAQF